MTKFLTILACVFGVLALIRVIVCSVAANGETSILIRDAYYSASGKAICVLVVCIAWLVANA